MKHILIVEDDTTFAVMLQTWLSKKKFSVASVPGFLPEAMERISQYTWPGNLREMRNTVMRAALLAQGNPIRVEHLGIDMNIDKPINILHDPDSERTKIVSALQKCSGNKSKAAAMLGIDRKTLYNKLKLYQIE